MPAAHDSSIAAQTELRLAEGQAWPRLEHTPHHQVVCRPIPLLASQGCCTDATRHAAVTWPQAHAIATVIMADADRDTSSFGSLDFSEFMTYALHIHSPLPSPHITRHHY